MSDHNSNVRYLFYECNHHIVLDNVKLEIPQNSLQGEVDPNPANDHIVITKV